MSITDLLKPTEVYLDVELGSKKDILGFLSDRVSERCGSRAEVCRHALAAREKLGSTAIGAGIALPHAQLDGLDQAMAMLVRPAQPVAYAAADEGPVDLIIMLLTPAGATREHLEDLASLARELRSADTVRALREARTPEEAISAFGH
jgi:PTS system nitrogen regulatory IIA component